MIHGIDAYFRETAAFRWRLGSTMALVAMLLLGVFLSWNSLSRIPAVESRLRSIPIVRWGYEGRDQYARRIELRADARVLSRYLGTQAHYVPAAQKGGRRSRAADHPNAPPEVRKRLDEEEGDGRIDRLARARAQVMNVPLVQSEDLIIEQLVRPEYPDEALDREIQGKVAVLALVDTTGRVAAVEVVGTSEGGLLEHAAEEAVWKCRFRPYQVEGEKQTVYALFRFAFSID